jgi:hypothetical protein
MSFLNNGHVIGQPTIHADSMQFTFLIECPPSCGKFHVFCGRIGMMIGCPKCKRVYQLSGMPTLSPEGQLRVPLGVAQA